MTQVLNRWVIATTMVVTFSVTSPSLAADNDDSETRSLPQRQFRVTVTDVVSDNLAIVKRVAIDTHRNSWIQVTQNSPVRNSVSHRMRAKGGDERTKTFQLVILGDRLLWESRGVDMLKFYMSLQGVTLISTVGQMPKGTELSDVLNVSLKTGTYPYDSPVTVLRFRDESRDLVYRLVVTDQAKRPDGQMSKDDQDRPE